MSDSQEIEVEVVEVVDKEPAKQSAHESKAHPASRPKQAAADGSQRPFGRGIPIRSLRIPVYLWPLAIIFGLALFLLAITVGVLIAIPFLLIRAILRLFR